MANYRIAVIVGSLRKDSYNRRLANALSRMAPTEFALTQLRIDDLPLFNQDDEARPVDAVRRFKSEVAAAHGVLFVTPEYNRSMPGVLKNAIDQGSRPYGQSAWPGKPAGIIGVSIGAIGTALAQQHLRNSLVFLDMHAMAQPEAFLQVNDGFFDAQGNVGPASRDFVQKWLNRYLAWVKLHSQGQGPVTK